MYSIFELIEMFTIDLIDGDGKAGWIDPNGKAGWGPSEEGKAGW